MYSIRSSFSFCADTEYNSAAVANPRLASPGPRQGGAMPRGGTFGEKKE